jgi:hypothetical protein
MGLRDRWRPPWGRSSRSLGEFEEPLHQHQSTQSGGLLLRTYASADRFIIGSLNEWLHRPQLLGSTSPRVATSMHRDRRPRQPGSTSACAAMSARSSNESDYFDLARTIGGLPTTISTTRLDLKTSRNRLRLVELHQQIIAAPSTSSTVSSTFIHESS